MLAKAGIQKSLKFLDSGSRNPGLWSGVARNDAQLFNGYRKHHTSWSDKKHHLYRD